MACLLCKSERSDYLQAGRSSARQFLVALEIWMLYEVRNPTFVRLQYQPTCRILSIPYVDRNITALYLLKPLTQFQTFSLREDTEAIDIISDQTAQVSSNRYVPCPDNCTPAILASCLPKTSFRRMTSPAACSMIRHGKASHQIAMQTPCRRPVSVAAAQSLAAGDGDAKWKAHVQVFLALSGLNGRHAKGLEVGVSFT
jgi:hypothetical protein